MEATFKIVPQRCFQQLLIINVAYLYQQVIVHMWKVFSFWLFRKVCSVSAERARRVRAPYSRTAYTYRSGGANGRRVRAAATPVARKGRKLISTTKIYIFQIMAVFYVLMEK